MRTMSGDACLHYDCTNRNSFGYCKTTACINPIAEVCYSNAEAPKETLDWLKEEADI